MSVEDLLSQIEDLLDEGKPALMAAGKVRVDSDAIRRIVDEIRLEMPEEIKQARKIAAERKLILDKAQQQAAARIKQGELQAAQMVEEHELTRAAKENAAQIISDARAEAADIIEKSKESYNEIVNNAQKWASDLRQGASNFVDTIISDTENILRQGVDNFTNSLDKINIVNQQLKNANVKKSDNI